MDLQLRLAKGSDTQAVRDVDGSARRGDPEQIALLNQAIESGFCLIAETSTIIGYVVTTPGRFYSRDFIDLLVVHEQFRRRGVGRALLRSAIDRAGSARVFSSTNASNAPMQALFAAERWSLSGQLDGLDEHDPELVYFTDKTVIDPPHGGAI